MTSPFDVLDQVLSSAAEAAFGEVAILRPRVSSQYAARRTDENRGASQVTGVFSAGPVDQQLKGQARSGEFAGTTRLESSSSEFWISRAKLATVGFAISKGDAVSFPGRCGSPVYSVAAIQRTSQGDVALILVIEDQPA